MEQIHSKVIILGSGPAGLTAAIYTARANLKPLLVHGPLPYGQLSTTTEVENFPGFPEGVQGPELMTLMEAQGKRFGTTFYQDTIKEVNLESRPFRLFSNKREFSCDALIVATGASPKLLGVPGEQELWGYGISTCATCDGAFFRDKVIAVVGGGDSACEEASFLTRFGSKVYLLHRRGELRASKIMQDRVLKHEKIQVIWNVAVKEILGNKKDGVQKLLLETLVNGSASGKTSEIECQGVFIAIGHIPQSTLFKNFLETDENGYLLPAPNSTKSKIDGVFLCGDVQDHVFRQAITAAGSGCMAAIEAERYLESVGK
jgi:thioredoxin reductase (NADPH)